MIEEDNNFKINLFDIDEDSGFNNIIEELKDDNTPPASDTTEGDPPDDSETSEAVVSEEETEDVENQESNEDDETEDDSSNENEDENEEELSDVDKSIAKYIEDGYLLLPDDYEYEDNDEAVEKAFKDSEEFRNQLAMTKAFEFLTSKEGLDLVKVQSSVNTINSYKELDVEKATDDQKTATIRASLQKRGFDEDDIIEKIEDAEELDKTDSEFKKALKYLVKVEEAELESQKEATIKANEEAKKQFNESKNLLKTTLDKNDDFNGYSISKSKREIMDSVYKPAETEDGSPTTEFNMKLSEALNNPSTFLVLADMLLNMGKDGFDFSFVSKKAESKATTKVKKSIRKLKNSNTKSRVSGKQSTSPDGFDLSKASLFQLNK